MPNNAEHIKYLEHALFRARKEGDGPTAESIAIAIRALRTEGHSPWRKVTKRHPGKKWVGKMVVVYHESGKVYNTFMVPFSHWHCWCDNKGGGNIIQWQPWPEHPEKGKVK